MYVPDSEQQDAKMLQTDTALSAIKQIKCNMLFDFKGRCPGGSSDGTLLECMFLSGSLTADKIISCKI